MCGPIYGTLIAGTTYCGQDGHLGLHGASLMVSIRYLYL